MLRVNTKPRHRNAPRPAEKSAPRFLQWLRGRSCTFAVYSQHPCGGKIEAMHLDFAGGKGIGAKVSDAYCIPGCTSHHRLQHDLGWDTFCKRMNVTKPMLLDASTRFWHAWPGRIAHERKLAELGK